jgi:tetratricopeptide (TPR) repeat protein
MEGDYKKALATYRETLNVLPDLNSPLMNNILYIEHRAQINRFMISVYLGMIECYDKLGDYKNQINLYKKIISIDPYFLPIYKKIADVYYKEGKLDEAIYYNKRGYMLNPNDYAWPFAIALLYKEKGDNLKVLEYAEKSLALNRENNDIRKLIENLNNKNDVR